LAFIVLLHPAMKNPKRRRLELRVNHIAELTQLTQVVGGRTNTNGATTSCGCTSTVGANTARMPRTCTDHDC